MIKWLVFLLTTCSCAAEQNWLQTVNTDKELIYVVSTRPLGEIYGHPLAVALSSLYYPKGYVYASYLGFTAGVGTSSEQLMHSVDQDIQRMQPTRIILDQVEASSYLLDLLPKKYHAHTTVISKGADVLPESVTKVRLKSLAVVITNLIDNMNIFPDKFYILFDASGLTARDSFQLKKSLSSFRISSIESVEISTIQQLDDFLIDINKQQRGVIINNLMTLKDTELNTTIDLGKIKETLVRRNLKHLEIGFNYLPNSRNESVILELDYAKWAADYSAGIVSKSPYSFRLIISRSQMRKLKLKNNYIAALKGIDALSD